MQVCQMTDVMSIDMLIISIGIVIMSTDIVVVSEDVMILSIDIKAGQFTIIRPCAIAMSIAISIMSIHIMIMQIVNKATFLFSDVADKL